MVKLLMFGFLRYSLETYRSLLAQFNPVSNVIASSTSQQSGICKLLFRFMKYPEIILLHVYMQTDLERCYPFNQTLCMSFNEQ